MKTLKYSRQRESIKACLMSRKDHPTGRRPLHQHPGTVSEYQPWNRLPQFKPVS